MTNGLRSTLLLLFVLVVSSTTTAQVRTVKIQGLVETSNQEPVPFASIVLYDTLQAGPVSGTLSDSLGHFYLNLKPGVYRFEISFLSFQSYSDTITVKPGEAKNVGTIILEPKIAALSDLDVKANRSQMELSFEKRVFQVGKDITAIGGSALDVLNNVPSLITDFKGNISLRGNNSVRILINGKPSKIYRNGSKALQSLPADMIKEIQVITNPSAKYEAEGSAGIINIILKKNKDDGFNGSIGAMQRLPEATQVYSNLNYRSGNINWFLNGSIAYNKDPAHSRTYQRYNSPDTSYIYRKFTDGRETDDHGSLDTGADFFITENQTLTANLSWSFEDKKDRLHGAYVDSTLNGVFLNRVNISEHIGGGENETEVSLEYENLINDEDHMLTASATYQYYKEQEFPKLWETNVQNTEASSYYQTNDTREGETLTFKTDYTVSLLNKSKAETGLQVDYSSQDNTYITQEEQNGTLVTLPEFNNNFNTSDYLQSVYFIFSSKKGVFDYQVGLRAERYHIQTKQKTAKNRIRQDYLNMFPSAYATYHFNEQRSIQLSYSRRISRPYASFLLPSLNFSSSRSQFSGNQNLKPEYADSYEIQFLQFLEQGSLLSSIYYRHRSGVIERITKLNEQGISLRIPINLSTADSWGVEFTGDYQFSKQFRLSGNANIFRSESHGAYQGKFYESSANRITTRFGIEAKITGELKYQAFVRYLGPTKTIQGDRSPTAFVNMSLSKDLFSNHATLSINSSDVFNTRKSKYTLIAPDFISKRQYWEPSGIRVNFLYRINPSKSEDG